MRSWLPAPKKRWPRQVVATVATMAAAAAADDREQEEVLAAAVASIAEAMLDQSDADGDGKLAGDEIPERMSENFATIDTDGDDAVSKDEWTAYIESRRAQRGGGGGPGAGQDGPPRKSANARHWKSNAWAVVLRLRSQDIHAFESCDSVRRILTLSSPATPFAGYSRFLPQTKLIMCGLPSLASCERSRRTTSILRTESQDYKHRRCR